MTGRTVDSRLDPFYVGLPHPVGPPVGVADLDAEGDTLIAILTLCHLVAPPPMGGKSLFLIVRADNTIPDSRKNCKNNLSFSLVKVFLFFFFS